MGLGASIVCTLALLGLRALIAEAGWLYLGFKLAGGVYLIYLAWRLWRESSAAHAGVLFHFSLLYLALLFVAVAIDAAVR